MILRHLPVLAHRASQTLVECRVCAQCCTYVAVEIDQPSTLRNASTILWFLYHDKVSVVMERKDRWAVQFDTRCKHLGDDLLCAIYPWRPQVCREYDNRDCEVNGRGNGRTFRAPAEFLDYLRRERPRIYRLLERRFLAPENGGPPVAGHLPLRGKKKSPRGHRRAGL